MRRRLVLRVRDLSLCALLASAGAHGGGVFPIDHTVTTTDSGIWARKYTQGLEYAVIGTEALGALWFGGESAAGKTCWQTIDASVFSALTAQGMKYVFRRERPTQTSDPNQWFKRTSNQSFPSGEVTLQASFVTPFIVNYAERAPSVWGLEVLPAFDAVARVKEGAHWQTDVLAGWALGTGFGYFSTRYDTPFFLNILPHGFMVGLRAQF